MADKTYNIQITINGKDNASAPLGNVNNALDSMGKIAGGVLLARGIEALAGGLVSLGKGAVEAASQMQLFDISLQTLAAREQVATGNANNIEEALKDIGPVAADLKEQLKELSLTSPFTFDTIQSTFRFQLAFGNTTDMSVKLTGAMMDTAAALGLTNEATDRMAYNFGQIHSVGKIMALDLRQLRMVGLDLAAVFRDQLGMSIEQVNAALETGKMTMDDVSMAFVHYAEENFGGAAERMSRTFIGLQSSMKDFFTFAGADLMTPALEAVTDTLGEVFDQLRVLLDSGYFQELGGELGENVVRIMTALGISGDSLVGVIESLAEGVVNVSGAVADMLEGWNSMDPVLKEVIVDAGLMATGILILTPKVLALAASFQALAVAGTAAKLAMIGLPVALIGLVAVAEQGAKNFDDMTQAVHDEIDANAMSCESYNGYMTVLTNALEAKGLLSEADGRALVDAARREIAVDSLAVSQRGLTESLGILTAAQWEAQKRIVPLSEMTGALGNAVRYLMEHQDEAVETSKDWTEALTEEIAASTKDTAAIQSRADMYKYQMLNYELAHAALIPVTMELADSLDLVGSALEDVGIKGDEQASIIQQLGIATGELEPREAALDQQMRLVALSFATGGMTAQQLAGYMQQAAAGTLNLSQEEQKSLAHHAAAKQAMDELANSVHGLATNQLTLAQNLKDATQAQIAQAAVQELQKAYDAGKISFEQFSTAVSGVQQTFGLATPQSQALALGVQGLVLGMEAGRLPAVNFDDALKYLVVDSQDGSVNMETLLGKFDTVDSTMTPANAAFNSAEYQLRNLGTAVFNLDETIEQYEWNALGQSVGDGLAAGMMASVPAVEAAAKALAEAAKGGVADGLEMESPSRVMMEQGSLAALSFAMGMTQMMSSVESSLSGLFYGASYGGGNSTISGSYNETYNLNLDDHEALDILLEKKRVAQLERANGLM